MTVSRDVTWSWTDRGQLQLQAVVGNLYRKRGKDIQNKLTVNELVHITQTHQQSVLLGEISNVVRSKQISYWRLESSRIMLWKLHTLQQAFVLKSYFSLTLSFLNPWVIKEKRWGELLCRFAFQVPIISASTTRRTADKIIVRKLFTDSIHQSSFAAPVWQTFAYFHRLDY